MGGELKLAIVYPGAIDSFSVPTDPENTSLSSAGTSTRNHPQSHADLGAAIVALETHTAPLTHDHSNGDTESATWHTSQLLQANTHQSPDTDASQLALHHTLGPLPTQAAPGNHAHDYTGSSIFNKPWIICTSTTRPAAPQVGMMIYETDTNCARVWSAFPGNTIASGISYTYTFNSANSATSLDGTVFSQTYPTGSSPTNGSMGAPNSGNCVWQRGTNSRCRSIARAVKTGVATTDGDDQTLYFTTGLTQMQGMFVLTREVADPSPTNDAYLRMSADGQSYVRFSLDDQGALLWTTTTGPSGEVFLGGVFAATAFQNSKWTCKAIGDTYVLYSGDARTVLGDGTQIMAVTDYQGIVNVGAGYRGWGIGMSAAVGDQGVQLIPNNLTSVTITEPVFHTSNLIWQLTNFAAVPHIRAEARFTQEIVTGPGARVAYDTVTSDWRVPFVAPEVSETDIVIQESGHYNIHASNCWDPSDNGFDQATVGITINGQDVGRKNREFVRGSGYAPGFPQTNEIYISYYLAAGDVIRVQAQHNAPTQSRLGYVPTSPNIQVCYIEVDFCGP